MTAAALWPVLAVVAVSAGSAALLGWFLVRLPPDHFVHTSDRVAAPHVRWLQRLGGVCLVLGGIVMALPGIPGQGLLSILAGLVLLDLPVLRPLELRLLGLAVVRRGLTALRAKAGQPPLEFPPPP